MKSPRRLSAAEHRRQPVESGIHLRRHGQSREDDERNEKIKDTGIGHFLQRVVFFFLRGFAPQVEIVEHHGKNLLCVLRRQKKLAQMAGQKVIEKIEQAVEYKNPGEKKVPSSSPGEPEKTGDCHPAWKGPWKWAHVGVLDAQEACRHHPQPVKRGVPSNLPILVRGVDREEGLVRLRLASPMKVGKGVENLQPAHEEDQKRERIDPVGCASNPVMSIG